jgi:monoamine oxidase
MVSQAPDYLSIARGGLQPGGGAARKVIVVGAGMAGLVSGYELLRAGHDVTILEARQRVGGRVYTMRDPFTEGLHGEAGAMRIPRSHALTMAYVEKLGLRVYPFTMHNPRAYYHVNGRRHRIAEAETDPGCLGFELAVDERGRTVGQLWEETLHPILDRLRTAGDAAWPEIVAQYDHYSVREFLQAGRRSEGAVEMFGLLMNQEGLMNTAFLELLREEAGQCYTNLVQIEGGMDRLPQAFLPALAGRIHFGAKVTAIDQTTDSVTVYYRTLAGQTQVKGDHAILTIPFPALRHVEALKPFSRAKQRAIRQLHYDLATKILIQCRRRFWETEDGIWGGTTVTDLPIRNVHYPEHGRETGRGVLLASYTWGEDARSWGSLDPADRITRAAENLAQVHPQARDALEVGASKVWQDDPLAGGAFAIFEPSQQSALHEHIVAAEGRLHFAGEHASLTHCWIQGAVESGLRVALEIHHAPPTSNHSLDWRNLNATDL